MLKVDANSFRHVEEDVLRDVGLLALRGKFGYVVVETFDVLHSGLEPNQCVWVDQVQEDRAIQRFN